MIEKSVQNAVVHRMHELLKLMEINPEALGQYSDRVTTVLKMAHLIKEAFSNFMPAGEFDSRADIILGIDSTGIAKMREQIESLRGLIIAQETNYGKDLGEKEAQLQSAKSISDELRAILSLSEDKLTKAEVAITEVHKIMASQREQINREVLDNKTLSDELAALKAENLALKSENKSETKTV